jgi:subtilisin family serine protease
MQTSLSYSWLTRLITCALAALSAACSDVSEPMDAALLELPLMGERPYYLHQGQPVYLDVDNARLVVSAVGGQSEVELKASLSMAGLDGARLEYMPFMPNAFMVHLASNASPREVMKAVSTLRNDRRYGFVANVYRWEKDGSDVVLHNRLVVHLKKGFGAKAIERLTREFDAQILREPHGGAEEYWLTYPKGVDPLVFALLLGQRPEVEWVDPDKTAARQLLAIPSDPYFNAQYYARNPIALNDVPVDDNAEWAWDLTYGAWPPSAGPFVISVVDDGVETSHPDLNSGFAFGYDAFTDTWSSVGCADCATNPAGNDSHGTQAAGIIKAQHNNGIGSAGLAPAVKLLPVRIFKNGVPASDAQIAMGINAAWQNDAQVLSNSWGGGPGSNAITDAINRATTQGRGGKGSVVVFSAGNTSSRADGVVGGVTYPALLSNVIAVGAINRNGMLTNYSPEGTALDIVAPSGHFTGVCIGDVVTSDLTGMRGCNSSPDGNTDYSGTFSGTSAAAPQVSAAAAMVLSLAPTLTEAAVRNQLTANADPWGPSTQFGSGKLNAYRALVGRVGVTISGPSSPSTKGSYIYTADAWNGVGSYSYRWSFSRNGGPYYLIKPRTPPNTVSVTVNECDLIHLRVTVIDGPDNHRVMANKIVAGPMPGSAACP